VPRGWWRQLPRGSAVTAGLRGLRLGPAVQRLQRVTRPRRGAAGGDSDKFKEINEAYDVLRDPEKRKIYDEAPAARLLSTAGLQARVAGPRA